MKALVVVILFALGAASVGAAPPSPSPSPSTPIVRAPHFHGGLGVPAGTVPRRVVSLSPAVTETLFVLGAGDRVVGVTRFCDRPAEAAKRPHVGGYVDASLEAILALGPDLVVAQPSFGQRVLLDRLHERGIPVFVVFADTVAENADLMRSLGALFGAVERSAALVDRQRALFTSSVSSPSMSRPRVAVVVGTAPLVVAGRHSFADDAVRGAGVTSVIDDGDPAWPQWSIEVVAARRVDVIVAAEGPQQVARLERLLAPLGARRPQIVAASTSILMRPGPSLVDDTVTLRALLAPQPGKAP